MKDEEEILDAWQKRTDRVSAGADPVLALWGDRLS